MKDINKVLSDKGNKEIVLINKKSDPAMWVINVYKKILFFKVKDASFWFNSEKDAVEYARVHFG